MQAEVENRVVDFPELFPKSEPNVLRSHEIIIISILLTHITNLISNSELSRWIEFISKISTDLVISDGYDVHVLNTADELQNDVHMGLR